MIDIKKTVKGTQYVMASDLHKHLQITTRLSTWFPRMIEYGFKEDTDYKPLHKNVQSTSSMESRKKDWAVRIEMAKHIAMIQRSEEGKQLREYLISLDKKVHDGKLLDTKQIKVLFELCRVFGFFSVQTQLESEHFGTFEGKSSEWWQYRAKILGHSKADLKNILEGIGKKYQNQRQALFHIDRYELIRVATFDLFKILGKSDEYAKNVSYFAKDIADEIKPEVYDDRGDSINFKSSEQMETIEKINNRGNSGYLEDF